MEPEGTSALAASSRALFLETVRKSNAACQNGDYALAATLYTEALSLDPLSHVLYSNRSAARLKMGHFALALQDAVRATELLPQWPKVILKNNNNSFDFNNYSRCKVLIKLFLQLNF